ncbi:MAG: T9SS type A sorting domain-containing protein, partial [Chitinispirillia bacterium]
SICVSAQKKCMLIGATPGRENSTYDKFIIPQLEEWGYTVDKKHNCIDIKSFTEEHYAKYDFIFLSETVHSSLMGPLRSIPLPMMCSDGFGVQETALAFAKGKPCKLIDTEPIKIMDAGKDHPLAAGIAPGTVTDVCEVGIVWNTPSIPVISIACLASDESKMMVYGIEKGTKNAVGDEIKNRVAMFGIHAFGYSSLTENSVKLFKAGIEWVLAGNSTSIKDVKTFNPANVILTEYYPNPFNLSPDITFFIPKQSKIYLTVWNVLGKKVKTVVNGVRTAGEHTISLNASNIPSGTYLINIKAENSSYSQKITFNKGERNSF